MLCNEFSYPQAEIGSGMRLRFRTPEEELIRVVFAHETVAVNRIETRLDLPEYRTLTKLRTNIGAPYRSNRLSK